MGKAAADEQWHVSVARRGVGRAARAAVRLWLPESHEGGPLGPTDTTEEVWEKQQRTRLKQGDWGQEDTGVLAGAHLAPFWVTQLANERNERGRNI